jgi:hypothetical protein
MSCLEIISALDSGTSDGSFNLSYATALPVPIFCSNCSILKSAFCSCCEVWLSSTLKKDKNYSLIKNIKIRLIVNKIVYVRYYLRDQYSKSLQIKCLLDFL